MAITNFESNLRTIRLSIREGYPACVTIKKLNTGSYNYITRAMNNPGGNVSILPSSNIYKHTFKNDECSNIEVDDLNLYNHVLYNIPGQ